MRKYITMTVIALLIIGLTAPSFAARYKKTMGVSYSVIEGKVLSINPAAGAFVVQDDDDGTQKTVYATSKHIASLNQGSQVKITVSQPGDFVQEIK